MEAGKVLLSMEAYFDRLFAKYDLGELKPKSTPFPPSLMLLISQSPQNDDDHTFMENKPYQEMVGALLFATTACCLDISYATNVLSRFSGNPGRPHWNALIHLLCYILGTKDYSIVYSQDTPDALTPVTYVNVHF